MARSLGDVWRAFDNNYWPALYSSMRKAASAITNSAKHPMRKSECVIQRLLTEAGAIGLSHHLTAVDGQGFEAAADWPDLKSPEIYLGNDRTQGFSSTCGGFVGRRHSYAAPTQLTLNQ